MKHLFIILYGLYSFTGPWLPGALIQAQQIEPSVQWSDTNIPVVHLSIKQRPAIQIDYKNTVNANQGDLVFLDTLINVLGTPDYSISWNRINNQNYVPVNKIIQVFENTTLYFLLSYNNGCTYTDNITLYTGVTERNIKTIGSCNLYPNPAKEKINIEITNASLPVNVILYNLTGTKVFEKEIEAGTDTPVIELNIANQVPGIYFIRLNTHKELIVEKVLIIR